MVTRVYSFNDLTFGPVTPPRARDSFAGPFLGVHFANVRTVCIVLHAPHLKRAQTLALVRRYLRESEAMLAAASDTALVETLVVVGDFNADLSRASLRAFGLEARRRQGARHMLLSEFCVRGRLDLYVGARRRVASSRRRGRRAPERPPARSHGGEVE